MSNFQRRWSALTLSLLSVAVLGAGSSRAAEFQSAPFDEAHWMLRGEATAVAQQGQPALRLRDGKAILKAPPFATGVIEYDVLAPKAVVYTGLRFRGQDAENYEYFYLRPDRSGHADANQYTPVLHGASGWQIYYGPDYSSAESYKTEGWNHVEVRLYPDAADVYINGQRSLRIADLKGGWASGFLALSSSPGGRYGPDTAFYANFRYRAEPLQRPADLPPPQRFDPPGLIRQWRVSAAMSEAQALALVAGARAFGWTALAPETNGLANLARVAAPAPPAASVVARFEVNAQKAGGRMLRLGYSDRVRLLVNGETVFAADAGFQSRDEQFQGVAGFHDAVALPLKRGRNTVDLVVSETFGGWAAGAWFEDPAGLSGPALRPVP